jgi:hypothetical protein
VLCEEINSVEWEVNATRTQAILPRLLEGYPTILTRNEATQD